MRAADHSWYSGKEDRNRIYIKKTKLNWTDRIYRRLERSNPGWEPWRLLGTHTAAIDQFYADAETKNKEKQTLKSEQHSRKISCCKEIAKKLNTYSSLKSVCLSRWNKWYPNMIKICVKRLTGKQRITFVHRQRYKPKKIMANVGWVEETTACPVVGLVWPVVSLAWPLVNLAWPVVSLA